MAKTKTTTKDEKEVVAEAPKVSVKVPKKKIVAGTLHVEATFNNTKVVLSDKEGNTLFWTSAGSQGFRGAKKGTPFAASKCGSVIGEKAKAHFRNQTIGIVFQSFELIAPFTALENITTPLDIAGKKDIQLAHEWIESVGLGDRKDALPSTLSGGEKQRVAIARALIMHPSVVLADEPTGNLDRTTAEGVFDVMLNTAQSQGTAFVVVTHDAHLAARCSRVLRLDRGVLQP